MSPTMLQPRPGRPDGVRGGTLALTVLTVEPIAVTVVGAGLVTWRPHRR